MAKNLSYNASPATLEFGEWAEEDRASMRDRNRDMRITPVTRNIQRRGLRSLHGHGRFLVLFEEVVSYLLQRD